ncbi:DUF2953 domain-containing protein [Metallumcola ferriviriculae]|uniref:DUF2953 domain-containing protein n=1 Tax=Metallumcola ferriviriculae TaxID=3039180 RepID=A0AAU0URX6_9FIRM|nr:DUF2953 domain-containing protein [Desulfitibacteraceae bacterium MK1]
MFKYYLFFYPLIVLAVFTIPVTVRFMYNRHRADDHLMVYWRPFGLIPLGKLEIPVITLHFEGLQPIVELLGELEAIHQRPIIKKNLKIRSKSLPWYKLPKIISITPEVGVAMYKVIYINKKLMRNIRCKKLYWQTEFGFRDASLTGLTAGSLWAFKNMVYQFMASNMKMNPRKDTLEVLPNFERPGFQLDFDCIVSMRLGHIIIAGSRVMLLVISLAMKTVQMKGVKAWQKIIQLNH